ncbi:MAG: protein BatD [Bacteroidaceae bacterium]|nr:protein BatD [Bacteroidaceae bacterium]
MNISNKTKRLLLPVILLLMAGIQAIAQDVSFTAQAPQAVVVGERFRITYKVDSRDSKEFRAPDMKSLNVLAGPSTSTSSSTQIINGQISSSYTMTYTYVVVATQEGDVELDGATITAGGKQVTSNRLTIKVLPPDQTSQQQQGSRQGQGSSQSANQRTSGQTSTASSADELFMLATVDKTTVYEQEALLLTFKIYKLPSVDLRTMSNKMPDLKNCHVQEVELPQQKEFNLEHYNGRNYQTMVWSQYVLFPQHSGELEIPATPFEGVVAQRVENRSNDVFDMFFNSSRYVEVKKDLTTRSIKINVKPLPQGKSSAFYGGVGDFTISSSISTTDVTANDAVTVRVILSGTGNLKLVKTPEIKFPQDFDIYDPKVENKYTIKGGRQTGNKVYEYLVIPRHAGQYTIPALEFQYFDPKSASYKTVKTDEYTLNVAKGQGGGESQTSVSYVNKEDLKYVGQDVRFHATPVALKSDSTQFFGSLLFWLLLVLPLVILLALVVISRKRIADNANIAKVRVKKASSVASKRLKVARKLMKENRKNEFYDEMMRALLGYFGDKLSIPVAELSKDNIQSELKRRAVAEEPVKQVVALLDDCEFARFAPGDDTGRMDRIYEQAVGVIGQIENSIK